MPQYGRMPTEKMGFLCRNGVAISINGTYGCYVIRIKIDYYMDISSYQLRIEHTWNRSTNIRYTFNSPQDMPANVCVCVFIQSFQSSLTWAWNCNRCCNVYFVHTHIVHKTYEMDSFEFLFRKERFVASACVSHPIVRALSFRDDFVVVWFVVDDFGTIVVISACDLVVARKF